jgi:hypothetical protein
MEVRRVANVEFEVEQTKVEREHVLCVRSGPRHRTLRPALRRCRAEDPALDPDRARPPLRRYRGPRPAGGDSRKFFRTVR